MKNSIEKKHQNKIFSPLKRINNRCSWTTWRTRAWFSTATSKIRSDFLRPTSTTRAPTTSTPPPSNASPPTPTGSSTSHRSRRQWRHCTTTASEMSLLQVNKKVETFYCIKIVIHNKMTSLFNLFRFLIMPWKLFKGQCENQRRYLSESAWSD